jgi:hypothetical protein
VRDANANISANSFYANSVTTTASGTVVTLTASSASVYVVTGSGGQIYQLPDATTLPVGAIFTFNNNQSSGSVTVRNNSGTTVATVQSGAFAETVLVTNTPAAGSWETHFLVPSNASWSTNTLDWAGSITSATWNGVAVAVNRGGTGLASYTLGDIIYASGTTTLASLADVATGNALISGGIGAAPSYGKIGLTTHVSGILPVANGGTGASTLTANNVVLGNGTSAVQFVAPSTSGYVLVSNGTTWTSSNTITSPILVTPTINDGYIEEVVTANTTTAYTISLTGGTFQILTLTGNCTFTFPTATAGQSFMMFLKQDATGSRTVTWPAEVKWPSSTAPTITATASKGDKFVFTADGTNWLGSVAGQAYL